MKNVAYRLRLWIQIAFAALTNGYVTGFLGARIYTGSSKQICVPGLNCYSCPGALGACPLGALQAVVGSRQYQFSFYIVGFLVAAGALGGRIICGFLCPFGLVQDLLYKIPFPRKRTRIPGERVLKYTKYALLALFVLILPATVLNVVGQGDPWFCKWICPSGTLMGGFPLLAGSASLRAAAGALFGWKTCVLLAVLVSSIVFWRPFCRLFCPLGAIYGLFNPAALYRFHVDDRKCTHCGACRRACRMGLDPSVSANSPECIRCGECVRKCPHQALSGSFGVKERGCRACAGCPESGKRKRG